MEKTLGVPARRTLPALRLARRSRAGSRSARPPKVDGPPVAKVVLFPTCSVEWNRPEIGKAAVQVLETNNVEVAVDYPHCCGMPFFDVGDVDARREARAGRSSRR